MKRIKREKGITLIALVITIIILLILAGVSISIVSGEGLFSKAKGAVEEYSLSAEKEEISLTIYEYRIESMQEPGTANYGGNLSSSNLEALANKFDSKGYEYVYLQSSESSAVQNDGGTTWIALHLKKKASDRVEFIITRTARILDTSAGEIENTVLIEDANIANGENIGSTPTTCTLTYNANGGSGTINAVTVNYNEGVVVTHGTTLTPPSESKKFYNWNTQPDGSGDSYHGEYTTGSAHSIGHGLVDADIINLTSDLVLYAQWTDKERYTVSYNLSPSSETISSSQVYEGDTITIAAPTITTFNKDDYRYTFNGYWNPDPANTGGKIGPGTQWVVDDDVQFGASWTTESLLIEEVGTIDSEEP